MKLLPDGALNFRSLGGIPAGEGKVIRPGVLYRSGDLGALRDVCRQRIQALGIRTFVDLRSDGERRSRPYEWDRDPEFELWNHAAENSDASIRSLMAHARSTVTEVTAAMKELYRSLPVTHASSYAKIFSAAASGQVPLLFACAAGKDRTGVGAALLLWSLDVSREEIVRDYLQSNLCVSALEEMAATRFGWDPQAGTVQAVLRADEIYLDAMFQEVEAKWGNVRNYLQTELKIDAAILHRIGQRVLE